MRAALMLLALVGPPVRAHNDNGILGDPYVNCGPNSIDVRFDTRSPFRGVIFVKDQLEWPECRSAPAGAYAPLASNASISLNFRDCGLERRKSSNPRGIFLGTQLVVSFQPDYLTKFDRAFNVSCFYAERQCALAKELLVEMGPAAEHRRQVPMPVCRYEVLAGGARGPPVRHARVGQPVYHKWSCAAAAAAHQFCMLVHSCRVDDGNGDRVDLIDANGCAKDKFLLSNLDYISDLEVGKEAHVYKYADRPNLFFDCQISVTVKEPGQEFCDVPNCPDPPRRRRFQSSDVMPDGNLTGVSTQYAIHKDLTPAHGIFGLVDTSLCFSDLGLALFMGANLVAMAFAATLFCHAFRRSQFSFDL